MGRDDDDDRRSLAPSRKIMLAAIFSLFAVVFLIIILYLYSRYLLNRQERRRVAALRRLSSQIAPDVANSASEQSKPGLDPLVIASLPTFTYKLINKLDRGEPIECSVCLGTLVEDVLVRQLPNCKHMFHVECIDMWLGSHTTCPICRTVAEPRVQPEEKDFGSGVQPSAPPLEVDFQLEKVGGSSSSRLGSFRKMITRERSSSRTRSCGDEIGAEDLERQ